jgi:hypothetical protein
MSMRIFSALALLAGCSSSGPYDPGVKPSDFAKSVTNRLLPYPPGARWVYNATTSEGVERIEVEVLTETKRVAWGVDSTVVRDTVYVDDEKVEDTKDWFAQHADGSVWYMGEDTAEYENGEIVNHEGAWEAGADGALPGMLMPASPAVGQSFRQEYYEGEAEDFAEIVALDASVTVPAGSWTSCVKTHETSLIDSSLSEFKYYCPGIGLALVEEGSVRVELVELSGLMP